MDDILKDKRFAHIVRDPQFKRIPKKERKIKIDKRFQSMFTDDRFKIRYTIDKRGRPTNTTSTEDLKRYYDLETSSESGESADEEEEIEERSKKEKSGKVDRATSMESLSKNKKSKEAKVPAGFTVTPIGDKSVKKQVAKVELRDDSDSEGSDSDSADFNDNDSNFHTGDGDESDREVVPVSEKVRKRLQDFSVDYARGEGLLETDSSSDESTDDDAEDEEENVDHGWGELDRDAELTSEATCRLALCNMDWDSVRAPDLMVLFNSFLPKGGVIHSVTVYPSEFGLQRLKEEEEKGPRELRELAEERKERGEDKEDEVEEEGEESRRTEFDDSKDGSDADEDGDEGAVYRREKLRQYELTRLRYFYAVLVCDSPQTANALYEECDGMEYENSSARLDMRFVPDDTTFDQPPRETCTQLPNLQKYEPLPFINTALQQSKVQLSWDNTDPRRAKFTDKVMSGKTEDIDEEDLKAFLASSSSEEENEEGDGDKEDAAAKYRALLESIDSQESKKKEEKNMDMEISWGIELKQKLDQRAKEGAPEQMTPFEQMMHKKKEKMKAKREARRLKLAHPQNGKGEEKDGNEDASSGEDDDIPSDVDLNDDYFKEEFDNDKFEKPVKKENKKGGKKKNRRGEPKEVDEEAEKRKAELELLLMDGDDGKQHFNLNDILVKEKTGKKNKKKKRKAAEVEEKQDDFKINVKDDRFSALYTSHLYNIDPADPHYKKTQGMEALRAEKLNRRDPVDPLPSKVAKAESLETKKLNPEMSLLVKNIKRKTLLAHK